MNFQRLNYAPYLEQIPGIEDFDEKQLVAWT